MYRPLAGWRKWLFFALAAIPIVFFLYSEWRRQRQLEETGHELQQMFQR